jgi:glycosyltransferase involved in cell wall biosynthesis
MPLLFLNRFYAPDVSATAQLLTDLAEDLAARGEEVTVLTSRLRYDDPAARLPARERRNGVRVCRVWTSRFGRAWLPGRAIDYATFYLSATAALLAEARRGDLVVAMTDPPLLSVPAALVAGLRGARLVLWCQDLFPEIAAAHGLRFARGRLGRLLRALRDWSLRRAETVVAIHPTMASRLAALGVPEARIRVIENWAPTGIRPVPHAANPLRREWGLAGPSRAMGNSEEKDRFVVAYSGNLGRVHDPAHVIDLVRRTSGRGVTWLFIGGGAGMAELARVVEAEKLPDVLFRPYQPRERLAESLSVADLHLVSLHPAFEGLVWPSKIYGIEAAGRPWIRLRPGLAVEDLRRAARRTPRPRAERPGVEAWAALLGAVTTPARLAAAVEA